MNRFLVVPLLIACSGYTTWTLSDPPGDLQTEDRYVSPDWHAESGTMLQAGQVKDVLLSKWNATKSHRQVFSRAMRPRPCRFNPEVTVHQPALPIDGVLTGTLLLRHVKDDARVSTHPFVIDRRTGNTAVFGDQAWIEFEAWAKTL